jgi:2-oxoglutarate dehydrogenase E2 component (dihydrolipoamide succinyltransferase)
MKVEIKVPEVGESITEVVIASWLKKNGSFVKQNDLLCEIESDKASFELPAEHNGQLEIVVDEGETIAVGKVIGSINIDAHDKKTESIQTSSSEFAGADDNGKAQKVKAANDKPVEIRIPEIGESVSEVTLSKWLKKDGEHVQRDNLICEIESDKASFEIPAESSGELTIKVNEGETISVGTLIATIKTTGDFRGKSPEESAAKEDEKVMGKEIQDKHEVSRVTPVAKNILENAGINYSNLKGSGESGKITKEDALKAVEELSTNDKEPEAEVIKAPADPGEKIQTASGFRETKRKKLTTLRKTLSERLVAAKNQTAMLTTFNEIDMSEIMILRKRYKEMFKEKYGVNLGFMSFFTKAVCAAIQEFPEINAKIENEEIVYHDFCDISIAVSVPKGLVVPVIRNAEGMELHEIEKQVEILAAKAKDNKLSIEEMTGGTFTISNGGIFGSLLSTPILNAPQSAILGMHKIQDRPVVIDGQIVAKPMMYVALSYDHRLVDGRESVSFLVKIKEMLEDPARLLLNI